MMIRQKVKYKYLGGAAGELVAAAASAAGCPYHQKLMQQQYSINDHETTSPTSRNQDHQTKNNKHLNDEYHHHHHHHYHQSVAHQLIDEEQQVSNNNHQFISASPTIINQAEPETKATTTTATATNTKVQPFESIPGPRPSLPFIGTNWTYLPLVGPFSGLDMNEINQLKYQKYGPIMKEELAPGVQMLTIFEPTDIKQVFKSEAACPARPALEYIVKHRESDLERYPNIGLANMMGSEWRELRSKMSPVLRSRNLKNRFIKSQNRVSQRLVDYVCRNASNKFQHQEPETNNDDDEIMQQQQQELSSVIYDIDNNNSQHHVIDNVQDIFSRYAMESIMNLCISHEITCLGQGAEEEEEVTKTSNCNDNSMAAEDGEKILQAAMLFFEAQHQLYYGNRILNYFKSDQQYKQLCTNHDHIHDIASKYIDRVIEKLETNSTSEYERETILDTLYRSQNFTNMLDIKASIVDFIIGGIYPLANALTMTLYLLATNPSAQERVYEEIMTNQHHQQQQQQKNGHKPLKSRSSSDNINVDHHVIDDPTESVGHDIKFDQESLERLKYLRMCLKEAHRMMPTIPGIARIVQRDLTLSNYHVPKNTLVFCNSMTTCRMAKYFKQPDEFRPERWDRNSPLRDTSRNPDLNFAMLQFGYGARKCIGHTFADLQMNIAIAKLISSYQIEPVDPGADSSNLEREFNFIVVPKKPVKLKFIPRKSKHVAAEAS